MSILCLLLGYAFLSDFLVIAIVWMSWLILKKGAKTRVILSSTMLL